MVISYYLKTAVSGPVTVTISDATGKEVARLTGPSAAGINRLVWSTRVGGGGGGRGGPVLAGAGAGRGGRGGAGGRGATVTTAGDAEGTPPGRGSVNPLDQWMPLGEYKVMLDVGGKTFVQSARIVKTIGWGLNGATPRVIR
jgi:hypothetical protein